MTQPPKLAHAPKEYRKLVPLMAEVVNVLLCSGEEEGARQKSREVARKLREQGVPWRVVTEATGVKPSGLRGHSLEKPKS
jgi:hypothetical protein